MSGAGRPSAARALAGVTSGDLLRFLEHQRWFDAKGNGASNARVDGAVPLPWDGDALVVARITLDVGGATRSYHVPLAARLELPADAPAHVALARVGGAGQTVTLFDAAHDDAFRRHLARVLGEGCSAASADGALRWIVVPSGNERTLIAGDLPIRVCTAEQSNTSLVVGDAAIVKLFRRLHEGINPDVEVTEHLTRRAGFRHTPALLGAVYLEEHGRRTTAGMAQRFVPNSTDAWSYTLDRARPYFLARAEREPANDFLRDSARLGTVTRAMHEALASDDACEDAAAAFAVEPATLDDLDDWTDRALGSMRSALDLLDDRIAWRDVPAAHAAEARALTGRRAHFEAWIAGVAADLGDDLGACTRVHGDYHLGQVLHTADDDFMIIDFEGEPSRSIAERRAATSPLRDVAGMLRSFSYAAATLAMEAARVEPRTRELRAARWERDVRRAFMEAYLRAPDDEAAELLPADEERVRRLTALFEAEKAFYELSYELNHRPAWAWIPMRGLARLFV
jgi:maltose alpha-D-glucosyltransferase/alpha-amylase